MRVVFDFYDATQLFNIIMKTMRVFEVAKSSLDGKVNYTENTLVLTILSASLQVPSKSYVLF